MKTIFFTFVSFFCITSFAFAQGEAEKILGYQPTDTGIVFQVKSGGCTDAKDFVAKLHRQSDQVTELTLIRVRPDLCYPFMPMGVKLKFSYESLGLSAAESFIVKNQNGIVQGWIWRDSGN